MLKKLGKLTKQIQGGYGAVEQPTDLGLLSFLSSLSFPNLTFLCVSQ